MYNLLKGKKGIIFGALNTHSIAWKTAERAHQEGAKFVLTNAPASIRMGDLEKLAKIPSFTEPPKGGLAIITSTFSDAEISFIDLANESS